MKNFAETLNQAFRDGLAMEIEDGKLAVTGPKPIIQKYANFIREHKAAILDYLTPDPLDSLIDAIREADELIHRLCDLKGRSPQHREAMLKARREMAPAKLQDEIEILRNMVNDRRTAA